MDDKELTKFIVDLSRCAVWDFTRALRHLDIIDSLGEDILDDGLIILWDVLKNPLFVEVKSREYAI